MRLGGGRWWGIRETGHMIGARCHCGSQTLVRGQHVFEYGHTWMLKHATYGCGPRQRRFF